MKVGRLKKELRIFWSHTMAYLLIWLISRNQVVHRTLHVSCLLTVAQLNLCCFSLHISAQRWIKFINFHVRGKQKVEIPHVWKPSNTIVCIRVGVLDTSIIQHSHSTMCIAAWCVVVVLSCNVPLTQWVCTTIIWLVALIMIFPMVIEKATLGILTSSRENRKEHVLHL